MVKDPDSAKTKKKLYLHFNRNHKSFRWLATNWRNMCFFCNGCCVLPMWLDCFGDTATALLWTKKASLNANEKRKSDFEVLCLVTKRVVYSIRLDCNVRKTRGNLVNIATMIYFGHSNEVKSLEFIAYKLYIKMGELGWLEWDWKPIWQTGYDTTSITNNKTHNVYERHVMK